MKYPVFWRRPYEINDCWFCNIKLVIEWKQWINPSECVGLRWPTLLHLHLWFIFGSQRIFKASKISGLRLLRFFVKICLRSCSKNLQSSNIFKEFLNWQESSYIFGQFSETEESLYLSLVHFQSSLPHFYEALQMRFQNSQFFVTLPRQHYSPQAW